MADTFAHIWYMTGRHLRNLARQPWYIGLTLFQPILYLLVFADLFKRVVEIPGFGAGNYLAFLTPGIVVISALFSSGWNGMSMIEDIDRGVLDRFLQSPVRRISLIAGRLAQLSAVIVIQTAIIISLALARGARFDGGILGVLVLLIAAIVLAVPFGAVSNGIALLARREETVIAAVNFLLLPLTFLSSVFMAPALMPGWIRAISRYNPVNWAVDAGRAALAASPDWGLIGSRLGFLVALAAFSIWFGTSAFRAYQRSV
ncbi:MAG: ABC transporter permease [Candidatus Geothermincolia bacterium]